MGQELTVSPLTANQRVQKDQLLSLERQPCCDQERHKISGLETGHTHIHKLFLFLLWVRLLVNFKSMGVRGGSRVYPGSQETGCIFTCDLGRLFNVSEF